MFWWLLACRVTAEVVDACDPADVDTAVCIACSSDEECGLQGNPCLDTVSCAHDDALLAFPDIGCSPATERRWPDEGVCTCQEGLCLSASRR